ncbi:MAG: isoamylase early set domain-containing protein [Saprospiraceae bacterium]|jgi:1,4-alpha-glucan branching enzyme|nr:isoamylase early set domain-containing protein [Saprospiraceae bacterium]
MSIKKSFLKSKPVCKVTFELDQAVVNGAEKVAVLGTFNNWTPTLELKKAKNGTFKGSIDLETGKAYEFRYLVDGSNWINDTAADEFTFAGIANEQNGVIAL